MQKQLIVMVAAAVALTGLVIGLAAAHGGKNGFASAIKISHPFQAGARASSESAANQSETAQNGRQGDANQVIRFVSNPLPAPPFLMTDLDGQAVSTAQWKGKVVILEFWATWCPPCRAEIPMLIHLQSRYKDKLEVVGMSVDDATPAEVKGFVKQMGMNYPVVMADERLVEEYGGVPALPTAFVINLDGKVVQKHVGLLPESLYDEEVRALLGMPVDARVETFVDQGQVFLKNAALATELPGVDMKGLTPAQKKEALKELNTETCQCGCGLTLAQCRIVDSPCLVSKKLANEVVKRILEKTHPTATDVPHNLSPIGAGASAPDEVRRSASTGQ